MRQYTTAQTTQLWFIALCLKQFLISSRFIAYPVQQLHREVAKYIVEVIAMPLKNTCWIYVSRGEEMHTEKFDAATS